MGETENKLNLSFLWSSMF